MLATLLASCSLAALVGIMTHTAAHEAAEEPPSSETSGEPALPPEIARTKAPPAVTPRATAIGPEGMLRMPDGSLVELLNGVRSAPDAHWTVPYAPILGKEKCPATGIDWYRHADGTMTTTIMLPRHEIGRTDATTIVAHPMPMTSPPKILRIEEVTGSMTGVSVMADK